MHWYYENISIFVILWVVFAVPGFCLSLWLIREALHDRWWALEEDPATMLPTISTGNAVQEVNRSVKLALLSGIGGYYCWYSHFTLPYHDQDVAPNSLSLVISIGSTAVVFCVFFGSAYAYFLRRRLKRMQPAFRAYKERLRAERANKV